MPLSLNYKFLLTVSTVSAAATTVLSIAIAQTIWYSYEHIPLFGRNSIASFLTSASMVYCYAITFMVTKATRNAVRAQQIFPLRWHLKNQTLIDQLSSHTAHRAFILGIAGSLMSALTIYLLSLKNYHVFNYQQLAAFSVAYFVLLSSSVAVVAAYRAMGDDVLKQVKVP